MLERLEKPRAEPTTVLPETQNALVASRLEEVAALLEEQHANPFRVTAYRRAAETRQYTVMTYTWGSLKDKWVVRGREAECKEFYGITASH